jgi:hypothetical protein
LGGACVVGGLGGRWGGLDLLKVALIFAADALQMRWGMEVFGTMTGVLNISSATRTGVIKH